MSPSSPVKRAPQHFLPTSRSTGQTTARHLSSPPSKAKMPSSPPLPAQASVPRPPLSMLPSRPGSRGSSPRSSGATPRIRKPSSWSPSSRVRRASRTISRARRAMVSPGRLLSTGHSLTGIAVPTSIYP